MTEHGHKEITMEICFVGLETCIFRERFQKMSCLWRIKVTTTLAAMATAIAILSNVPEIAAAQTAGKTMTTASGLQITDSKVGTGASPKPGQICVMHYTGWLYENGQKGKSGSARSSPAGTKVLPP